MTVIVLESVPTSLKGELSRWLLEASTGVYVGQVSALVRDLLWEKCVTYARRGRCTLLYRTNGEQGFAIRLHGDRTRTVLNFDGLDLIGVQDARWATYLEEVQARED
ncbi:CRISPR-associated protein Cas2 [Deinobacterium chartae]|uniref:CRISPR-associated protein Cas2 n=1 Tax=Deinobacterium chartae TaxID=521158 RepID=A0A841I4R1_9DEIO|nr:type I-E CRISPR-associated endoribonuclease Cas2e [Deinobacterium chartae]MBB6100006.1 CRISPR-associated protein Cas2 [Deinobacterium chartae]